MKTKGFYYNDSFYCKNDFILKGIYPSLNKPLNVECDYLEDNQTEEDQYVEI